MKKIYFSEEERRAGAKRKRAQWLAANAQHVSEYRSAWRKEINRRRRAIYNARVRGPYEKMHTVDDPVSPRPPLEVVLEHQLRCELIKIHNSTTVMVGDLTSVINGDPPPPYAANYPGTAFKQQAAFRVVGW